MDSCVVFDIETTGFHPDVDRITEIGGIKVIDGAVVEVFNELINPGVPIPKEIVALTGITAELVKDKPMIGEVLPRFLEFCEAYPVMGHNILFDFSFIKSNALREKLRFDKWGVDTLSIARSFLPNLERRSLEHLCQHYGIRRDNAHRGYDDALATYKVYCCLKEQFYNEETKACFEAKPLHWKPQKQEPITPKQVKFLSDLIRRYGVVLDKPVSEYSKSEASRQIDLLLLQFGRTKEA